MPIGFSAHQLVLAIYRVRVLRRMPQIKVSSYSRSGRECRGGAPAGSTHLVGAEAANNSPCMTKGSNATLGINQRNAYEQDKQPSTGTSLFLSFEKSVASGIVAVAALSSGPPASPRSACNCVACCVLCNLDVHQACACGASRQGTLPLPLASHAQVTGKTITSLTISGTLPDTQRNGGLSSLIAKTTCAVSSASDVR